MGGIDHKAEVLAAAESFAAQVKRLLEDDGRQPADPFQGLPPAERATCDRDFVL